MAAEDLLVRIDATTEALRRELRKGDGEVAKFAADTDRRLAGIDGKFDKLGAAFGKLRGLVAPLAAALGGLSLVDLGLDALELADNIDDTAGQLQVTTDYLQAMRYAAEQTGVEAGALENAIAKLNGKIGDAVSGQKSAVESFERVGIAFKNADGSARGVEQVMAELADRIKELPDPAQRAAAAAEILGEKAGPRLVALLSGGAEELTNWLNRAKEAGQVMESETVKRLAAAEQRIKDFKNFLTISAGEILIALDNLRADPEEGARIRLEQVNKEIEQTKEAIANMESGNLLSGVAKFFGGMEEAQARLNRLLEERNRLLNAAPNRTKDDFVPGGGGTAAGLPPPASDTAKAKNIREVTSALAEQLSTQQEQIALLNEEGAARAKLEAIFRAQDAARRDYEAGLRDSPLLTEEEIDILDRYTQSIYTLQEAHKGIRAKVLDAKDATDAWSESIKSVGEEALRSFADVVTGAERADVAIGRLISSLAAALANESGLWENLAKGLSNFLGGGLPPGIMDDPNGAAPGRAIGGDVTAGMSYKVGEMGPELFVPRMSGTIIPNGRLGSGFVVNVGGIHVSTTGGTPAQNADGARRAAQAVDRAIGSLFDERLALHLRDRGMLKPNIV